MSMSFPREVQENMEGYRTIAVFGVDTRNLETGRSDVIMLININNATKEVKLVSVLPRYLLECTGRNHRR